MTSHLTWNLGINYDLLSLILTFLQFSTFMIIYRELRWFMLSRDDISNKYYIIFNMYIKYTKSIFIKAEW